MSAQPKIRTSFAFTLPHGSGFTPSLGSKVTGSMRLITVKDVLTIQRDARIKEHTPTYYLIMLTRVIEKLGTEKMITNKTIESLHPADFVFLIDMMNAVNHRVVRSIPVQCAECGETYWGELAQLGKM